MVQLLALDLVVLFEFAKLEYFPACKMHMLRYSFIIFQTIQSNFFISTVIFVDGPWHNPNEISNLHLFLMFG